jgi:hypothetical protein
MYETGSGGSIVISENDIQNDSGIFTPVYLVMFSSISPYWGNNVFNISIDSQTEKALTSNSLDSKGKENIKRAIESDLSNLTFADFDVSLVEIDDNRMKINIVANNNQTLQMVWDFTKSQVIEFRII